MLFMNQLIKANIYCHLKERNEQLQLLNNYEKSLKKIFFDMVFFQVAFLSHS